MATGSMATVRPAAGVGWIPSDDHAVDGLYAQPSGCASTSLGSHAQSSVPVDRDGLLRDLLVACGYAQRGSDDPGDGDEEGPPLYGEQLVLDTYLQRPRRRVDWKRQAELAKPRLLQNRWVGSVLPWPVQNAGVNTRDAQASGSDCNAKASSVSHRPTTKAETHAKHMNVSGVVERLSTPRQRPTDINTGEAIMLAALKTTRGRLQATTTDEVVARVSKPLPSRTRAPPSGELIVLKYASMNKTDRAVDLEHIARLATPRTKAGAESNVCLARPPSAPATRGVRSLNPRLVCVTGD